MSTPKDLPRILSVDDDKALHKMLNVFLADVGQFETLNSDGWDVNAAINAIREKLEGLDVLILDGVFANNNKKTTGQAELENMATNGQTALEIIQQLAPELESRGITVIVLSSTLEVLAAVRSFFPSVTTIKKPGIRSVLEAVQSRVPFQENQAS